MSFRRALGGEPQRREERVGGGALGFAADPFLDAGEPFGRLVDVVAVGNVDKRLEQLFEAIGATAARARRRHPAARRTPPRSPSVDLSHPSAFPRGIPAAALRALRAAG